MIVSIDSNVIVGLWNPDDALNLLARKALDDAFSAGGLVICGAVYAELLTCPGRSEEFVDQFLRDTDISVDWNMGETVWRTAGSAFKAYADRRRKRTLDGPRRILADFLIGAHALENGYSLLTLDAGIYRAAFPELRVSRV